MCKIKSKVLNIFDYKKVPLEGILEPFTMDEEDYQHEIDKIRKKNAQIVNGESIETGDIVTISCKSDNTRFNKEETTFKTGLGLFSKELENQVISMKVGQTKEFNVKGNQVIVFVKKIERSVLPETTDSNITNWNIGEVKTISELKEYIFNTMKKEYIDDSAEGLALYISNEVIRQSVFELDQDDISLEEAHARDFANDMIKSQGYDPETITEEEMKSISGRTLDEHMEFIKEITMDSFKSSLIGFQMMNLAQHETTDEEYEEALRLYQEGMGVDMKTAMEKLNRRRFDLQQAANYQFQEIEQYAIKYLLGE